MFVVFTFSGETPDDLARSRLYLAVEAALLLLPDADLQAWHEVLWDPVRGRELVVHGERQADGMLEFRSPGLHTLRIHEKAIGGITPPP